MVTETRGSQGLGRRTHGWIDLAVFTTRWRARSLSVFVFAVATAVLGASTLAIDDAWARGADTTDPAKAEEMIREANDLRRHGHDERAFPLLRKAYEIARSARTAGQLGLVEMALGYWVAASGHLEEALAESSSSWVEKNRATLDNALRTAQSHVGELRVEGKPDGAEVLVNGIVAGVLPLANPLRLGEGRINLEVRAPGRRSMTTSLNLAGRATESVHVALERSDQTSGPAVAIPTVTRDTPPRPLETGSARTSLGPAGGGSPARASAPAAGSEAASADAGADEPGATEEVLPTWRRVLPWTMLGGAVAAGAIGAWQQVGSRNAQTSFEAIAACGAASPMRGTDPRCQGYYNDFETKRTRAYVSYAVAGILAAGAVTMFIVNAASAPAASASADPPLPDASLALVAGGAVLCYGRRF